MGDDQRLPLGIRPFSLTHRCCQSRTALPNSRDIIGTFWAGSAGPSYSFMILIPPRTNAGDFASCHLHITYTRFLTSPIVVQLEASRPRSCYNMA